jgi:hypothetical protein
MADRQCNKPSIAKAWATPSTCKDFFQYLLSLDGSIVDQTTNAVTFPCRYTTDDIGEACSQYKPAAPYAACSSTLTVDELNQLLQSMPNVLKMYELLYIFMMLLGSIGALSVPLVCCICVLLKKK